MLSSHAAKTPPLGMPILRIQLQKSETLRVSKYLSPAISETGVDTTAEAASKRRAMI